MQKVQGSPWDDQFTGQEQQDARPQQSLGEFGGPASELRERGVDNGQQAAWKVATGEAIKTCWCSQVPDQLQEAVYCPTNEFLPPADRHH